MKKKISLILCLVTMVLTMEGCGTNPSSVDYFGMGYAEMQAFMGQQVESLLALSEEDKESILLYGDEMTQKLVFTWEEATQNLGEYQGLGEFSATRTQKTVTVEQIVRFAEREVVLTYVYAYNYEAKQPEVTDATADLVYTLGEKMMKAALNTLMGMGTVFAMLILISLIIYGFILIPQIQTMFAGKKEPETKAEAQIASQAEVAAVPQVQAQDNLELVAVIAAAIAAASGQSADSFVVRSIRRR